MQNDTKERATSLAEAALLRSGMYLTGAACQCAAAGCLVAFYPGMRLKCSLQLRQVSPANICHVSRLVEAQPPASLTVLSYPC